MLPFLHKYIAASPSPQPSKPASKSHRSSHRHGSSSSSARKSKSKPIDVDVNNAQTVPAHTQPLTGNVNVNANVIAATQAMTTTFSSDTIHSQSRKSFKSENSSTSKSKSCNVAHIFSASNLDPIQDENGGDLEHKHMHNELPSTSESKVIFIETQPEQTSDSESSNTGKKNKKKSKKQATKYWTVSIASKHNVVDTDFINNANNNSNSNDSNKKQKKMSSSSKSTKQINMGFGICEMLHCDDSLMVDLNTNQLLNSSNYGYGYCVTYSDHHKYQSYHTNLKSLDDILIAFNTQSNRLTLWQNGKRFNRVFQLQHAKIYGFGIKLYGNDYCIKIMPNTGN